jgi:hypothetical protein
MKIVFTASTPKLQSRRHPEREADGGGILPSALLPRDGGPLWQGLMGPPQALPSGWAVLLYIYNLRSARLRSEPLRVALGKKLDISDLKVA